jgi:protein SCO1
MNLPSRSAHRLIWLCASFGAALLLLAALLASLRWRASLGPPLPVLGQVAPFSLTNQDGQTISLSSLRGHVWVADVIFTRCAGPCLKMSRQMKQLQDALPPGGGVRLVSLTTDPGYDTPKVLKTYGQRFGADNARWMFLTGTKQQLADLETGSLKLSALAKKPGEQQDPVDLFIHSTIFVVVDKQGGLRAFFETTGDQVDPQKVQPGILAAVRRLEHEG